MNKASPLLKFVFIFSLCLLFKDALAQRTPLETIKTHQIQPKKNLFKVSQPIFFIYKRYLPFNILSLKVNYWKTKGSFGINLNQSAFSNNWSSGGVNSLALGTLLNYKGEYNKDGKNFTSELLLQYGKLKNAGQLERKTNDRIFYDNKAAMSLSKNWSFFGSISFESQFDSGFIYGKDTKGEETRKIISKFLAPGYLTESVGFEYKPKKSFSIRIGTGTARQTFMIDTTLYKNNAKNFGVPIGSKFKNELAFQVVTNFDKDIMENLNLKARYLIFDAYERLNNIDQRLDLTITARVNRLINVTVNGTALYDDNFSGKIQSTQSLALGILFKIPR